MTDYIQTSNDLLNQLKEQTDIIKILAKDYDDGFEPAAKSIATHIRVLVHDPSTSKSKFQSLLSQLNGKNIEFYDSALTYNPILSAKCESSEGLSIITPPELITGSIMPSSGLTIVSFSAKEARYIAPLDKGSPMKNFAHKVPLSEWWNGASVITDQYGVRYSRKDIILEVANTDGGAHIDPHLKKTYADLSRFNSMGWLFIKNGIKRTFVNNPVLPSIRQIAHEVLNTLQEVYPEL